MNKTPDFKNAEEEVKFWEKHSVADYWDDLAECEDTFKRPKLTPVTLKFDPITLKKIKMLAGKRGLSYNATQHNRRQYHTNLNLYPCYLSRMKTRPLCCFPIKR